jgi:hypothetical protein
MAKYQNDTMIDQALTWVKNNFTKVCVCSSQPTTFTQATSTYKLGTASHTITGSPGDYASGRQIAVPAKSSISITSAGAMAHIALVKSSGSILAYVTTIPASSQASVSASDIVNMSTWNIKIADAS